MISRLGKITNTGTRSELTIQVTSCYLSNLLGSDWEAYTALARQILPRELLTLGYQPHNICFRMLLYAVFNKGLNAIIGGIRWFVWEGFYFVL